jgi:hypothetical protein
VLAFAGRGVVKEFVAARYRARFARVRHTVQHLRVGGGWPLVILASASHATRRCNAEPETAAFRAAPADWPVQLASELIRVEAICNGQATRRRRRAEARALGARAHHHRARCPPRSSSSRLTVTRRRCGRWTLSTSPLDPPSPCLTIADTPDGQAVLHEARLHGPSLKDALSLYLRFSGLPAAVVEAATGAVDPSGPLKRVLYYSLVKDVQRRGTSIPAAHTLLERVSRSLGSRTDRSRMARALDEQSLQREEGVRRRSTPAQDRARPCTGLTADIPALVETAVGLRSTAPERSPRRKGPLLDVQR